MQPASVERLMEASGQWRCYCWRVSHGLMGFFFALAAYVQINDPDAAVWIVAYSIPAVLSLLISMNPQITGNFMWKSMSELHILVCTVGAVFLGWSLRRQFSKNIIQEEEGRELFGLVTVVTWMVLGHNSGKDNLGSLRVSLAVFIMAFLLVTWLYYYTHKELRSSWPSHCKDAI